MANLTLFLPDELKDRMEEHKQIRWSQVVRNIIQEELEDLEETERLAKKSRLTAQDVNTLSKKVDEAMGKHAEALLNEASGRR